MSTKRAWRRFLDCSSTRPVWNPWAGRYHPGANGLLDAVLRGRPLVVLAGDVGSGKSELAETIGDDVARRERVTITLLPMSLSTRGQGRVGEMTQLLSSAFEHTEEQARKLKDASGTSRGAVILLVDEADAIAQSREASQMHHEDRAGVNAFIRGIDRLGNGKYPAAVIMCTNRLGALDPAVQRRAADILTFARPDANQRTTVLASPLRQVGSFRAADCSCGQCYRSPSRGRLRFHILGPDATATAGHRASRLPRQCGGSGPSD